VTNLGDPSRTSWELIDIDKHPIEDGEDDVECGGQGIGTVKGEMKQAEKNGYGWVINT